MRERANERDRKIERNRHTDRHAEIESERGARERWRERDIYIERNTNRETERQLKRERERILDLLSSLQRPIYQADRSYHQARYFSLIKVVMTKTDIMHQVCERISTTRVMLHQSCTFMHFAFIQAPVGVFHGT